MTRLQRSCLQIALAFAALVTFVQWAPWLGAKQLSELAGTGLRHGEVPDDARSFSINHGEIVFHRHGTISDQPILFIVYTSILIISIGSMVLLSVRSKSKG